MVTLAEIPPHTFERTAMDSQYRVITDATADFPEGISEEMKIDVLPMPVEMGKKSFEHYADYRSMSAKEFYRCIREEGALPGTSQIPPQKYIDFMTPILKNGEDILYIAFSSGLSQTYNSSVLAFRTLREKFPERKIITVDSLGASGGEGLFVMSAAENRSNGMSIEENEKWCLDNRLHVAHYWTVDDLMHLRRGGRVSAISAFVGTALSIKPIGHVDEKGHLPALYKVRGRKAGIRKMADLFKETIIHPEDQTGLISHSDCIEDAETLKAYLEEMNLPLRKIMIGYIGPVIGAHFGPGGLALFFYADRR